MTSLTATGRWFQAAGGGPDASVRLFLFPHGGGAAAAYGRWSTLLPRDVELLLVQLPGRHDRRAEPPFTEVGAAVAALAEEVTGELDGRPYAFFGHSMGGMLAYRLAVALAADGVPPPVLLGVSSWAPGGARAGAREIGRLDEEELITLVREMGALPPAIGADPEMLRWVLPTLRADLCLYGSYVDDGAAPPCPLAAYGAREDPLLVPGAMTVWAARCPDFLGLSEYPGDHFYLEEEGVSVAADLVRHLRRLLPGR